MAIYVAGSLYTSRTDKFIQFYENYIEFTTSIFIQIHAHTLMDI